MMANRLAYTALAAWVLAYATNAYGANPDLQQLFFAACANPSGELAARCSETDGGLGNLSGDSESSLNPSQSLSGNQTSLRASLSRADDARTRSEGEPMVEGVRVDIGRFSLLANYSHTWEERDRQQDTDSERGFDADADTLEAGFDYRLSDSSFIGMMISYEKMKLDFDGDNPGVNFTPFSSAGSIDSASLGLTGFASFGLGSAGYLDLSAGYQSGDSDYRRSSVFQESNRAVAQTDSVVKGSTDNEEFWASVNVGWQMPVDSWSFGISGGLTYSDSQVDGYSERDVSGTGLAMRFSKVKQESTIGTLGLRVQRAVSTGSGVLVPYARLDYSHEFNDDASQVRTGYLLDTAGSTLSLTGDSPDTDFFIAALGISAILRNGWTPFIDVSYWAAYEDLDRTRLQVGLRKEL